METGSLDLAVGYILLPAKDRLSDGGDGEMCRVMDLKAVFFIFFLEFFGREKSSYLLQTRTRRFFLVIIRIKYTRVED